MILSESPSLIENTFIKRVQEYAYWTRA